MSIVGKDLSGKVVKAKNASYLKKMSRSLSLPAVLV